MTAKLKVITDFDGVYADSFEALFKINQLAMRTVGISITRDDLRRWFEKNIKQSKRELITDDEQYQRMAEKFFEHDGEIYSQVRLFDFAPDLIKGLNRIADLVVASSTRDVLIEDLLSRHQLRQYFSSIFGGKGLSKKKMFEKGVKQLDTSPREVFFITDTVGDLKEAQEFGLKTIAVTWGFHGRELVKTAQPDVIVDSPEQLVEYFAKQA